MQHRRKRWSVFNGNEQKRVLDLGVINCATERYGMASSDDSSVMTITRSHAVHCARRLLFLAFLAFASVVHANSIEFFGTSYDPVRPYDRVKILLDQSGQPPRPANIGATDVTIEFWIKGNAADHVYSAPDRCGNNGSGWIGAHILIDQDVAGGPSNGAWGVSLGGGNGVLAFGARSSQGAGVTLCTTTNVLNGQWRHIALQRNVSTGRLWIFVDGALNATAIGIPGDMSYLDNANTSLPNSDPYIVIGAEKQGVFPWYSFTGKMTELRFSTTLRYGSGTTLGAVFARPIARFAVDASTAALWRMNDGTGATVSDAVGASPAQMIVTDNKPAWSADSPFTAVAFNCALDVDGNGDAEARTDGVLIVRYLLGLRGNTLTDGAMGASPTRTGTALEDYIGALNLDLDDDGTVRASSDGLLVMRALRGASGSALVTNARASNARTADDIRNWIVTTHGTSCLPTN
jgi:hypothetical protein